MREFNQYRNALHSRESKRDDSYFSQGDGFGKKMRKPGDLLMQGNQQPWF